MEPESSLDALEMRIFHLMRVLRRRFAQDLSRHGLTFPQFMTLLSLERSGESCRMGPLAEATMQSAASMTAIVDRLLERGLVKRRRHPQDRRSVVVSLTEAGREMIHRVRADRRHAVKQVLAQLGPEEQARLLETLDKMIHFLEETEDTEENPPQRHREHRGS
ncbi:MAG TPA: MarR family transcriptional regulator [Thermoflexia bacterium]|jgi:DNA-binding MarR family transcriptional regulator|nr:MarR family transcriptional regulator [Thermoflexia bacterium]